MSATTTTTGPTKPTRFQKISTGMSSALTSATSALKSRKDSLVRDIAATPAAIRDSTATKGTGQILQGLKQTTLGVGQLVAAAPVQAVRAVITAPTRTTGYQVLDNAKNYVGEQIGSVVGSIKGKAQNLEKVPSFYKILFLVFFFIFFYKIILDMGIFFGLNQIDLVIYMAWFGIILLFLSFIGPKRSRLYN